MTVPLRTRYRKHAEMQNTAPRGFPTPMRKIELYSEKFLAHGYAALPECRTHPFAARNRVLESILLQRRVSELSVPREDQCGGTAPPSRPRFDEFRLHTAYIRQLKQFDLELFSLQSNKRPIRSGGQFAGRTLKLN
jgi:hypothetical protein